MRWTTRPIQASGPSSASTATPAASRTAKATRPITVASTRLLGTRAADDRRRDQDRKREHDGEGQEVRGRQPRDGAPPLEPGLDQHAVLQGGAEGSTSGRDLGQRVAGQLGFDDVGPSRPLQSDPLEQPEAGKRGALKSGHRRKPGEGELGEIAPRSEHVDQARGHEVERDRGDREPEGGSCQAARRSCLRLAPLDLPLGVCVVLDRPLDPIADRGRFRRHLSRPRHLSRSRSYRSSRSHVPRSVRLTG